MDDLISRQAVMDCFKKWQPYMATRLHEFEKELLQLPSVAIPSAEPKTGHWIEEDMFDGDVAYRCSECDELFWLEDGTPKDNGYDFCPKCGARMFEPQESEDKE